MKPLRAPFPWFGGKSRAAELIWTRFGDVPNFVEPFAGSLAVLLNRPTPAGIETVNDLDCYVANFWRALALGGADEVATYADWPVNEADLHARHLWLVNQALFRERMRSEPDWFDAKIAGWWVWGISCWIGSGWCSRPEWSGRISGCRAERAVHRNLALREPDDRRPHISHSGNGVHRKMPAMKRANGSGVHRTLREQEQALGDGFLCEKKRPDVHRKQTLSQQVPDISGHRSAAGRGVHASAKRHEVIRQWMEDLQFRLRRVRVCCGDWSRVLGRSPTECIGLTGILLDPPYSDRAERRKNIYAEDDLDLAHTVREWAIENGGNPLLRIALCGYEGEHLMPRGWTEVKWKANGGHGNAGQGVGRANAERERIWFSPHCLQPQAELFPE